MAYLEQLVGKPLDEMSEEELESIFLTGRVARENETAAHRAKGGGKKSKEPAPAKVAALSMELDLDDMPE